MPYLTESEYQKMHEQIRQRDELLEAAKAMVAELKIQQHGFGTFEAKLKAAISKAEGDSNGND